MRTKSKPEQWEDSEFVRRGQAQARKKTDRETELENLKDFLLRNGVQPFWANSALAWVRQAMAGNTHWVTDLHHPRVKVDPIYKCIKRLTVHCMLHSESGAAAGKITYTFGNGHKVNVETI